MYNVGKYGFSVRGYGGIEIRGMYRFSREKFKRCFDNFNEVILRAVLYKVFFYSIRGK